MNAPVTDLLTQAIECVRPALMESKSTKSRIRILWAACKKARDLGAIDVVTDDFIRLAVEVNFIDQRGRWTGEDVRDYVRRYGRDDVEHVLRYAFLGLNPFEGPQK